MNLSQYIESISTRFNTGISREHSYRGDLETLIRGLVTGVEITNEPANVTDCGNPDYVITKGAIPIGFIEAKDIGKDLNSKANKEQFDRYRKALDNLIITDYIWFQFFQNGQLVHEIRIADIKNGGIVANPDVFDKFTTLIINFCTYIGNTITSPKKLAGMMAAKARLLQVILEKAITFDTNPSDESRQENSELQQQYATFKEILIHDLTPQGFADIYAQTLAYGMFAARLHDDTLETFSRQEAAEKIPKSNPFLRKLFNHVAGNDIDERIKTTVDNLADVFRATDVKALLKNFGKATQTQDPIIHFYETFLAEYDPKLRKARGVWYTPEPVVSFIVRGVDEILKAEFGLKDGLADISKTTIDVEVQGAVVSKGKNKGKAITQSKEVHKVQVLDPATGTGTFLAEVVKFIYNGKFKAMQGAWSGYVDEHLIPRLNGFELLMASYAMAHLKLDMLLRDTGFTASKEQRFNIYLTNSLEEHHPDTGTLFSSWLSTEANEANHIKRDTPVMVVMGNPPYAVSSSNKSDWIQGLLKDYKKDLKERNIQPLSDDYIKFIRYGQHFIDKNGEGILAYISNNSFIDGVIHRQMRKSLLESFDKIYILDLHGNSKKKETAPDGGKDENVFDIMQGVSINIFIKHQATHSSSTPPAPHSVIPAKAGIQSAKMDSRLRGNDDGLAEVYHLDVFGKRKDKYETLSNNTLSSLAFEKLEYREPEYFFVPKDFELSEVYEAGFSVNDLFPVSSSGIKTHRDPFVVDLERRALQERMQTFFNSELNDDELRKKYSLKDNRDWSLHEARKHPFDKQSLRVMNYRPMDYRFIYYDSSVIDFDRLNVMQHFLGRKNIGILFPRQAITEKFGFFVTNIICDVNYTGVAGQYGAGLLFPLYLYPENESQDAQQNLDVSSAPLCLCGEKKERTPNLSPEIVTTIAQGLDLAFEPEKSGEAGKFAPIDLLDYIYAVLHSPTYRETYKEFLKIDFPRIPYPTDSQKFWDLVKLGGELRQIHLLESPKVEESISTFEGEGDNYEITSKLSKKDVEIYGDESSGLEVRVPINDDKYFDHIPLIAWEFYIGGYQPAQKWLKDRRGRKLSFDDIFHYQKIIVALSETDRIMQAIDNVSFEY